VPGPELSQWARNVLLAPLVDTGAMAGVRTILAAILPMRTILLNLMLKVG
jgi:hypothetical protein